MIKITDPQRFVEALKKAIELQDTSLVAQFEKFARWHENATKPSPYVEGEYIRDYSYNVVLGRDYDPLSFTFHEEREVFPDWNGINGGVLFYSNKWNMHT